MSKRVPLFVAAALLAGLQKASAESSAGSYFEASARWNVDVSALPPSVSTSKGGVILSIPLYPDNLIAIDSGVIYKGSKSEKFPSGTQFVKYVLSSGRTIFCATRPLSNLTGYRVRLFGANDKFPCLIDQNGDGKLDGVHHVLLGDATPIITYGKDGKYDAVEPISFHEIDGKQFDTILRLTVRWSPEKTDNGNLGLEMTITSAFEGGIVIWSRRDFLYSEVAQLPGISLDFRGTDSETLVAKITHAPRVVITSMGEALRIVAE